MLIYHWTKNPNQTIPYQIFLIWTAKTYLHINLLTSSVIRRLEKNGCRIYYFFSLSAVERVKVFLKKIQKHFASVFYIFIFFLNGFPTPQPNGWCWTKLFSILTVANRIKPKINIDYLLFECTFLLHTSNFRNCFLHENLKKRVFRWFTSAIHKPNLLKLF